MTQRIAVERKDVAAIAAATFPAYNGKKFSVVPSESVTFSDLNWSGGTRSEYAACTLDGQTLGNLSAYNAADPWRNRAEGSSCPVPAGACIVRHSMFCGRDTGLTIYVNPANMPALLPVNPDASELSDKQRIVLSLIGQYIPKYRRQYAAQAGIDADLYSSIVATLKTRGYLEPNGGLSVKGKNVPRVNV